MSSRDMGSVALGQKGRQVTRAGYGWQMVAHGSSDDASPEFLLYHEPDRWMFSGGDRILTDSGPAANRQVQPDLADSFPLPQYCGHMSATCM